MLDELPDCETGRDEEGRIPFEVIHSIKFNIFLAHTQIIYYKICFNQQNINQNCIFKFYLNLAKLLRCL